MLNLLPIPVLDGGHLLFYFVEWARGAPCRNESRLGECRLVSALSLGSCCWLWSMT
ncbi:site-2 protease family protein [Azotobacter chroococcum]